MAYTPVNRILLGAVLPMAVYYIGLWQGFPLAGALLASSWSLGVFGWYLISARAVDGFSGIGAVYVVSELLGLVLTRDPDWFLLSPIVSDGVMGGVFLLSMLFKKPLIQILAEQSAGPDAFPEDLRARDGFRHVWMTLSLIWGGAYVIKGVLKMAALSAMPTEAYLAVRVTMGWPVVLGLVAFSFWYPRRCWQEDE